MKAELRWVRVVTWLCVTTLVIMAGCEWFEGASKSASPTLAEAERLRVSGQNAEAAALAQRFIQENPSSREKSDALLLLGDCEMTMGQYAQAQRDYQEAQIKPRTNAIAARARFGMGEAAFAQDNYGDAVRGYESALKTGKGDIPAAKATYKLGLAQIRYGTWEEGRRRMREVRDSYGTSEQSELAREVLTVPTDTFELKCGAFKTQTGADAVVRQLQAQGLSPRTETIVRSGQTLISVRVGGYRTYGEAKTAMDKVRANRVEAFVFP